MQDYNTILKRLQVKKNSGLMLAASYWRLGKIELAGLVAECGTFIGIQEGVGIVEANFCKQRLCPSCAWRRSVKIYGGTSHILDYLDEKYGKDIKYLFLTLTVKNVFLEDLGKAIDDMAEAFKRLINNKAWKRRVKGAMRTLEITVNYEKRTAHPHYHLILAVDRSYATKGDKTYWTQEDWQRVWQKAARLDYAPQVYIERIKAQKKVRDACKTKGERERADRRAAVAEVSKYIAKDADYLIDSRDAQMDPDVAERLTDYLVEQLFEQLRGRRLVSYTGILREAQRDLKINPEAGELVDEMRDDINQVIRRYHWAAGLGRYVPGRRGEGMR